MENIYTFRYLSKLFYHNYYTTTTLIKTRNDMDLVNLGSDNGLLPEGNKPLSEPMLTSH